MEKGWRLQARGRGVAKGKRERSRHGLVEGEGDDVRWWMVVR